MTITTEQLAALEAAFEKATKGEWAYKPLEFDDWGVIRSAYGRDATGFLVAVSRAGKDYDRASHHAEKTDPFEPNGRFIALAHNLMPALLAAAKEAETLRGERDHWKAQFQCEAANARALDAAWEQTSALFEKAANTHDDNFSAGRKAGIEEAAKMLDDAGEYVAADLLRNPE